MTKNLFLSLTAALFVTSCSSKPEEPTRQAAAPFKPGASIEAKQVAAEEQTTHVAEIRFKKSSSTLSAAHKTDIERTIQQAATAGSIKNVLVITWADAEYPSVHTKKLSKEERDLVKDRNDHIKSFIGEKNKDLEVKTFSMAERPGYLKDLLSTTDSRLKKSFEVAGIPNTDTSIKNPSKASHSILIVEMK